MPIISSTLKKAENLDQIYQRLGICEQEITKFCQKWQITELALFGSILRDDFNSESDIDFLVTFGDDVSIGIFVLYDIEKELKFMVKRNIDFIFKQNIEKSPNWIRRGNILGTAQVIYN